MPATSQYHVVLDGQGYLIDLATYKKTVNEPFAPKRRSGDPGYGDLALASVWAQENWQLGFALDNWRSSWSNQSAGYHASSPAIDPHFGDLRLGRSLLSVYNAAGDTDYDGLLVYRGSIYAWQADSTDIHSSIDGSSGSWAVARSPAVATSHRSAALFDGDLWFGSGSNGQLERLSNATWTDAAATPAAASAKVTALASWTKALTAEILFVGHTLTGPDPDQCELTSFSQALVETVIAEFPYLQIDALFAYNDLLWIACSDDTGGNTHGAVYTYNGTRVELVQRLEDNAVLSFQTFNGRLYAGSKTRGKVWQATATGLELVFSFPDVTGVGAGGAGGVSSYAMPIRAMVVDDGRLQVPIVDTNGLGIYSYDGVGWSHLATGGLGQQPRGIVAFESDLYLSNQSSAGARVYRVERKAPTSTTWISAFFTAGLAATEKVWQRLEIFHAALLANESLTVDYELDGSGVWVTLGVSDTDAATTKNFNFATAIKSRRLRLRLTLAVTDQTKTPRVTGILVHYLVSPDVKAEWVFDVRLEGVAEHPLRRLDNSNEPTLGTALADTLWSSRGKKQTLSFTDLDAEAKTVHLVDLEETVGTATQRLGHQTKARVHLVEA